MPAQVWQARAAQGRGVDGFLLSHFPQETPMNHKHRPAGRKLPGQFSILFSETLLVIGWAALIPGLMWLGGAAGF